MEGSEDGGISRTANVDEAETTPSRPYPSYFPALTLDHLWTITDENEPHRQLLELLHLDEPVVGNHFFELLLAPAFRRYQEAHHDWQVAAAQALSCFTAQATAFVDRTHEQHTAFEETKGRLTADLPGFSTLWEAAQAKGIASKFAGAVVSLCGEGTVFLPWPVDPTVPLGFAAIFQRPAGRRRPAWKLPYQVTLVPSNDAVAVAVLLTELNRTTDMHVVAQEERIGQLRWGLALVETLIAAPRSGVGALPWQPPVEFRMYLDEIEARFPTPTGRTSDSVASRLVAATAKLLAQADPAQRDGIVYVLTRLLYNLGITHLYELFMSREMETAYAGTRLEHRPDNARRIQAMLDEADAALTEDVRQAHPAHSLEDIQGAYQNRWVALLPTRVGEGLGILAGRVFEVAADREPIAERVSALKQDHPQLSLFPYFTGPSTPVGAARSG